MAQFQVFANPNEATKKAFPYLLDVQSPLLDSLETRLVIPLAPATARPGSRIDELNPLLSVKGREMLVLTQQMAAIGRKDIGPFAGDAAAHRQAIVGAIDFLITGF